MDNQLVNIKSKDIYREGQMMQKKKKEEEKNTNELDQNQNLVDSLPFL